MDHIFSDAIQASPQPRRAACRPHNDLRWASRRRLLVIAQWRPRQGVAGAVLLISGSLIIAMSIAVRGGGRGQRAINSSFTCAPPTTTKETIIIRQATARGHYPPRRPHRWTCSGRRHENDDNETKPGGGGADCRSSGGCTSASGGRTIVVNRSLCFASRGRRFFVFMIIVIARGGIALSAEDRIDRSWYATTLPRMLGLLLKLHGGDSRSHFDAAPRQQPRRDWRLRTDPRDAEARVGELSAQQSAARRTAA